MLFKTLLVILLAASDVQGQYRWGVSYTTERICALVGTSVELGCTYSYPAGYNVQRAFWFYRWDSQGPADLSQDREYSGRVQYIPYWTNSNTLRISRLKESDSKNYCFRFLTGHPTGKYSGQPGVSLTVTGVQVKVKDKEGLRVTLTCSTSCTLSYSPVVTWYKNGEVIHYEKKNTLILTNSDDTDLFSCALSVDIRSPAVSVNCLKVEVHPDTVTEGEPVKLNCRVTCMHLNQSNNFIWYKNDQLLTGYRSDTSLEFTASSEAAGRYSCAAKGFEKLLSPASTLRVRCVKVEMESTTVSEGRLVKLTCKITCTHFPNSQTFLWYKNGESISYSDQNYRDTFQFTAHRQDGGKYSCAVRGYEHLPSPPVSVGHPPGSTSVSVSPSGATVEGNSVTLTCSSDANPPVHTYKWFKNGAVFSETGGPGDSYTIKNITRQDAGDYRCQAVNEVGTNFSPPERLDVQYPPKSLLVLARSSGATVEGSSVTLTCSSHANPPVHTYKWFKNGAVFSETGGSEDSYTIKNITQQDAGDYRCQAENEIGTNTSPPEHLDVQYPPKSSSVSVSPSGEIEKGSSVTLTCSSDANPPVQNYTWFKENKTGIWEAGTGKSLNFSNFRSWNSGLYYCVSQNKHGAQNASVELVQLKGGQSWIVAAAVGVAAVGVAVIVTCLFLGFRWVSKGRISRNDTAHTVGNREGNTSPIYDNVSGIPESRTETRGADRGNDNVPLHSSKNPSNTRKQEELLYATVQKPLPRGEDDVQYSSIRFLSSGASPRSPGSTVTEDSILYSSVCKYQT